MMPTFQMESGGITKEAGWSLDTRKDKEMHPSLEIPKENAALPILLFLA